tara:strand:+ start:3379 stop:3759 length:381 start_codon:yes stop_codon:yes gene_type:complete
MVGGVTLGLAWKMPDSETTKGYFRFLPRRFSEGLESFSSAEITQLEAHLSREYSSSHSSNAKELILMRELEKDHILNDLILIVNQALNGNRHLRPPATENLIHQDVSNLVGRLFAVREALLKKMGE